MQWKAYLYRSCRRPMSRITCSRKYRCSRMWIVAPVMSLILLYASCVHPCSIYTMAATRDMRWLFTGGDDGFIRKWDFLATLTGEQLLTQVQRHGMADSIDKAGVMVSAWENEEFPSSFNRTNATDHNQPYDPDTGAPPMVAEWSPVYSMDVHSEGVWCVSGCKSGNINVWSVRHEEGHCQEVLRGHRNAVSVLRITPGERGLISGSWDRTLNRWDLESGVIIRRFDSITSQVTSASFSPSSASSYSNSMTTVSPSTSSHPTAEDSLLMATSYDGNVYLFDQRVPNGTGKKLPPSLSGAPPYALSACWSADGKRIYCGRRNSTVDEFDVAEGRVIRTIRLPRDSGAVTCVTGMPNNRHILCASQDTVRLYDLDLAPDSKQLTAPSTPVPPPSVPRGSSITSDEVNSGNLPSRIMSPSHGSDSEILLPSRGIFTDGEMNTGIDSALGELNGLDDGGINGSSNILTTDLNEDLRRRNSRRISVVEMEQDLDTPPVVPFTVVPGVMNQAGVVSNMLTDPGKYYLVSATGNRGWEGLSANICLVYSMTPVVAEESSSTAAVER
ncbi:WD40-repeat-containing domain protein [Gaertneriomyces semiglobifer]|nr:WD40-repeat-containing domain protein [Gaertneriomyces semiglobifer]